MPRFEPLPSIGLADGARSEPTSRKRQAALGPPLAVGLLGLALAAAALFLSVAHGLPWLAILGEQLVGLSYVAAGTIAWLRRPGSLIGPAIAGAGVTWFIADFVLVPVAWITALAYALMWIPNQFAAFILLAYPTGRFFSGTARALFAAVVAVSVVQYVVRLFVLESSPDYGCDCQNPFAIVPNAALYDAVMLATRILVVLITLAILLLIVQRWRHSTPAGRRQLSPVLFAGVVGLAVFAGDVTAYSVGTTGVPGATGVTVLAGLTSVLLVIARAAVPIGFLFGLLRTRLDHALVGKLIVQLKHAPSPERLEAVLAATVHDQTLRLVYWSPTAGASRDRRGRLVRLTAEPGRMITLVERGGSPLAAIDHDAALSDDPELMAAVAAALELSVDRSRLETMVRAQTSESHSLPRGRVTFLFADIEGSTALLDLLGVRYADLLAEHRQLVRQIVREHGGREIDTRADEFFAVFPAGSTPGPAALAIQRAMRDHDWPGGVAVRVRIGLHTGEPDVGEEGYVGMDVHLVARLGTAGHGGQILISESARDTIVNELPPDARMVALGSFELRGIRGRHEVCQIVVPDLPGEFPRLRLSGSDLPSTSLDKDGDSTA
jgi:class 3 adenylate cyclase